MALGRKTGGRQKGTPNKINGTAKQNIAETFEKLGGVDWLYEIALQDPRAFLALYGKILPSELKAEVDANVAGLPTTITFVRPQDGD